MIWALWLALALAGDPPSPGAPPVPPVRQQTTLVLKVGRPLAVFDALKAEVERLGGWVAYWGEGRVRLRVPADHSDAFLAFVTHQGLVADRTSTREELGVEMGWWRGSARSDSAPPRPSPSGRRR